MTAIIAILINFDGLENELQMNTLIFLTFGMLILNIFVFYLLLGCDRKRNKNQERAAVYREGKK